MEIDLALNNEVEDFKEDYESIYLVAEKPKKESIKRKALIIKTEDTTSDSFSLSERFIETFFTAETSRPKLINIIK